MFNIRYIPALLILLCFATSCQEEYETTFQESPEARLQRAMDGYKEQLVSAQNGFRVLLTTGSGSSYFYYMKFAADGSVEMLTDFNRAASNTIGRGTWRLKALQNITLSFSTYSYIHLPADPDGDTSGGPYGQGQKSDNEFWFSRDDRGVLYLKGLQHGSTLEFIPATAEERSLLLAGRLTQIMDAGISVSGIQLPVSQTEVATLCFDNEHKRVAIQKLSADRREVELQVTSYALSMNGITFTKPLVGKNWSIRELFFDDATGSYYFNVGSERRDIVISSEPYLFETTRPFHEAIGNDYLAMEIPKDVPLRPLMGQSIAFLQAYQQSAKNLLEGPYRLTLDVIYLAFDPETNSVFFNINVTRDGTYFLCRLQYTYTLTAEGVYDFDYKAADENGQAIKDFIDPILAPLEAGLFKGHFVGGNIGIAGGLFSQDDPAFYFSGYLINE